MRLKREHTARKPVGSGTLARSTAEHSPAIGQMNASPYVNASMTPASPGSPNIIQPLNPRPKSSESLVSEEFFDTEMPNNQDDRSTTTSNTSSLHPQNLDRETNRKNIEPESLEEPQSSNKWAPDSTWTQNAPSISSRIVQPELRRSVTSSSSTTTGMSEVPNSANDASHLNANYGGWYDYQTGNSYGYDGYPQEMGYASQYSLAPDHSMHDQMMAQAHLQSQPELYHQYSNYQHPPGNYKPEFDIYQMYGYPQLDPADTNQAMHQQPVYPHNQYFNSGAELGESYTNLQDYEGNISKIPVSMDNNSRNHEIPCNPALSTFSMSPDRSIDSDQVSSPMVADSIKAAPQATPQREHIPGSNSSSSRRQIDPAGAADAPVGVIYNPVKSRSSSKNNALQLKSLHQNFPNEISPRSSVTQLDTPTSAVSQPFHTSINSPTSYDGSIRSAQQNSEYNEPITGSSGTLSSDGNELQRNSFDGQLQHQQTTPSKVKGPEEQKDAMLGIGMGSAYVQRTRADAGETQISRQPLTLPVGLKRTAKSAPMNVKPDFLRRAMNIQYTHLPQRMLETEVDDDDDDHDHGKSFGTIGHGNAALARVNSNRPSMSESFDSPRGSMVASHRSNSPVDSIIEQTGRIKLFVANPDDN